MLLFQDHGGQYQQQQQGNKGPPGSAFGRGGGRKSLGGQMGGGRPPGQQQQHNSVSTIRTLLVDRCVKTVGMVAKQAEPVVEYFGRLLSLLFASFGQD